MGAIMIKSVKPSAKNEVSGKQQQPQERNTQEDTVNYLPAQFTPSTILQMQRLIGNNAVQRMISNVSPIISPPLISANTAKGVIQLGREVTNAAENATLTIYIYPKAEVPDLGKATSALGSEVYLADREDKFPNHDARVTYLKWYTDVADEAAKQGNKIVVYCNAGIERSPLVAGLVLMKYGNIGDADSALVRLGAGKAVGRGGLQPYATEFVTGWLKFYQANKAAVDAPKQGRRRSASVSSTSTAATTTSTSTAAPTSSTSGRSAKKK
jgi:hypothetical protein